MTTKMTIGEAQQQMKTLVWQAVWGGLPDYSWWQGFEYLVGGDANPGILRVVVEDPQDEDGVIISQVSARTMLDAYYILDAQGITHCGGCHLIHDPDICTSDLILQVAVLGEVVYA